MTEKPLVSFCLKSYNQKQYLIEALKGAFAQTYRPLEIVISDDGSTDGSWEYIQQAVAGFRREHPDVAVVINRNEHNLGNLGNWQKCGELAHGELCIKADGDDVSLPERATRVVEEWMKAGKERIKIIHHGGWEINIRGRVIGLCEYHTARTPHGAVMAMTRDCFCGFGDIRFPMTVDDVVLGFRGLLRGGCDLSFDDCLVFYRIGSGISSARYMKRAAQIRCEEVALRSYEELMHEVHTACEWLSNEERRKWLSLFHEMALKRGMWLGLIGGKTFHERIVAWKACFSESKSLLLALYRLVYLLPCWLSNIFLLPMNALKCWRNYASAKVSRRGAERIFNRLVYEG